ncbi:MAG: Cna B-type domain-containing protein, partial [Firmicutes bacterium]|nr:Cna B-type domain-containing protein [Bacillota bacterium]
MANDKADDLHRDENGHFRIQPMESIMALVKMQAPSGDDARHYLSDEMNGHWGKSGQAYNNAYLLCTSIDKNTGEYDSDNFVRKDYTKVGLQEYSLTATKKWNDDSDRDGKRPDKITFRLFADGEDTGETRELNIAEGETEVAFEHIPYTTPDGDKIHYVIKEDPIEGYTASFDLDGTTYNYTNTHVPERIDLPGEKTWDGDEDNEEARPSSIDVILYANGQEKQRKTVTPDSKGYWKYEFTNLYKYENGKEIKYTIEEDKTPGTGNALESYVPDVDGLDILNTYHPFGDLKASKKITGTTAVSEDTEFAFTFEFTQEKKEDGETVDAPVFDEFDYEILDKDGEPVLDDGEPITGKVTTNSKIKIKGGQTIHVKDIPEYIKYNVTEEAVDGFTMTGVANDAGTIEPNETAEAEFTNTYNAKGQFNPVAKKVLFNRTLTKYQFSFELYEITENDEGEEVEELKGTATSDNTESVNPRDDGTVESSEAPVTFGALRYTQEDHGKTFRYRIKEIDRGKDGYTYTEDIYELEVKVTDNGDGTLKIEPTYKDAEGNTVDSAIFENTYEAEGDTTLRAWKDLTGRSLEEDEFTFELLDEKGNPIKNEDGTAVTAKNKSNGTVTFDPEDVDALNYDEKDIGKTYYYAIREAKGEDETVIYDEKIYGYAVKIVDNGDGTLYAEQSLATPVLDTDDPEKIVSWSTEDAALPIFKNSLKDGGFSIAKTTVDSEGADPNQEFRFKVRLIGEGMEDLEEIDYKTTSVAGDGDGSKSSNTKSSQKKTAGTESGAAAGSVSGRAAAKAGGAVRAGEDIASGTSYGVNWRITTEGELIIGNGEEQTFNIPLNRRDTDPYGWEGHSDEITSIRFDGKVHGRNNMSCLFNNCTNVTSIDLTGFETSQVTGMYLMFHGCEKVKYLDVSGMDTSSCTTFAAMFNVMYALEEIKGVSEFKTSNVTSMRYMFSLCTSLKSLDISKWDTSKVTNMRAMFNGMESLEELDISGFDTGRVQYMNEMFGDVGINSSGNNQDGLSNLNNLKKLDLGNINTSRVTNMSNMFTGLHNLEEINLGSGFTFKSNAILNTPEGEGYTGKWIHQDGNGNAYTPAELSANPSDLAGTWVWERENCYMVYFSAKGAAGGIAPKMFDPNKDEQLPANKFSKPGEEFSHWVVTDAEGNELDPEQTYENEEVIPAGTYEQNDRVYLKAVFVPVEKTAEMSDGEFEITMKAGEKAVFDNIPAGTAYQVYEDTPNGWILVEQNNVSGTIEPLVTSEASFVNKYEPGTTSAQFYGTKTLDYRAAAAGAFEFVLSEGNHAIETVSTKEGGFIQFSPIIYKEEDIGTHVYTIQEVDPHNNTLDWDAHTETVRVEVASDGDDGLIATVTYDKDGIKFSNKTRPGNLKLTKAAEGLTDANKDDVFTFKITLNNADGMPLGNDEQIFWYVERSKDDSDESTSNSGTKKGSVKFERPSLLDSDKKSNSTETTADSNKARTTVDNKKAEATALKSTKALRAVSAEDLNPADFRCTKAVQTYEVPVSGYYNFQAWGAQGSNTSGQYQNTPVRSYTGGKGGYTSGDVYLEQGTTIYVYVGGQGSRGNSYYNNPPKVFEGGFNGGGGVYSDQWYDGTGGGATDFRLTGGNWDTFDSLKSRIMVAAGGGGAGMWPGDSNSSATSPSRIEGGHGGAGGGLSGISGTSERYGGTPARAGTQTGAGQNASFGKGGTATTGWESGSTRRGNAAGGGGGYYGGGALGPYHKGGAGGSSFISGHAGCNAIAANSTQGSIVHTGSATHYSGTTFENTVMTAGNLSMPKPDGTTETGHSGDGYARITPIARDITFDPNGGTGSPVTETFEPGSLVLPHAEALSMSKDNHVFVGWAKNADALVPDYEADEDVVNKIGKTKTLYAVWMGENEFLLHLDANGGFVDPQFKRVEDNDTAVDLPEPTKPGTDIFAGWNTKADGSGDTFFDTVKGSQIGALPATTVTLYAQWLDGNANAKYKVEHYRQNPDGEGYSLYETDNRIGERGATVSPEEKEYEGYIIQDHDAEYTIPAVGEPDLVVKYYYNLLSYDVEFDGNGSTSGQMLDKQHMLGGKQEELWANEYHKKGSIFTGWNTEADGSGQQYVDRQKVKNLTKENGATVTLYAQWLSNEDGQLTPTNGEIIVKCKAGETIVIPDLPAGTTYTIEEIDNPAGWSQKGEIEGNGETIQAN